MNSTVSTQPVIKPQTFNDIINTHSLNLYLKSQIKD